MDNPNYIYVRITNKSCENYNGTTDNLKIYWALNKQWYNWNNSTSDSWNDIFPSGQISIPPILAGKEAIITIPWIVPDPSSFPTNQSTVDGKYSFSLLARIESNGDPMAYNEIGNVAGVTNNSKLRFYANVKNNNNIAWKNSIIINTSNLNKGLITLENPTDQIQNSYLELVKEDSESGKAIYDEAEVSLKMDETLYAAWERGGKLAQELDATAEEKRKMVQGNNVILDNISLNPNETGTAQLYFNFLTKELTEKNNYFYHIIQKDKETNQIIGGVTFEIKKDSRPMFVADAGTTKDVDKNEPITISAAQISEPAIYNWYDPDGTLICSGKDLSISTEVAKKFKLEVIATSDGFKDYAEVEVRLKPSNLSIIAPNPATENVNISYKLNNTGSAYLMIIGSYGTTGTSNNYILDLNSAESNIDISDYANGFYTVALVCNGIIVDAKTLIKN